MKPTYSDAGKLAWYPDIACPVCGGDVNSWDKRCSRALGYRQIVCEGLYLGRVSGHGGKSALCDGKPLRAGSVSGDMSMEQNQLTRDLYAAGYSGRITPLLRVLE